MNIDIEKLIETLTQYAATYALKLVAAILVLVIGKWLALKDSLSNFASGVMMILFRPFNVGDFVTAGGVTGKVANITVFNTILNTVDNKREIVPNSSITSDVITNVTANDTRRVDLVIGIGYEDDIRKTKDVLNRIVKEDERILELPEAKVAVSELADSSVNWQAHIRRRSRYRPVPVHVSCPD